MTGANFLQKAFILKRRIVIKLSEVHYILNVPKESLVVYDKENRCSNALVWEVLDYNGSNRINDSSCCIGCNNEH